MPSVAFLRAAGMLLAAYMSHRRERHRGRSLQRVFGADIVTTAEISDEVLDILSDIAPDEDLSGLVPDKPFREQLELDSMDFLDIVMELRKRHRIQIPEQDYEQLASMASTVAYLEPRMRDVVRK